MRGKPVRGAGANPPESECEFWFYKEIYDSGTESPGKQTWAKSKPLESEQKDGQRKQPRDLDTIDITTGISAEPEENFVAEPRQKKQQLPTKGDMAKMSARLESSIKSDSKKGGWNRSAVGITNVQHKNAKRPDGRTTERT